MPRFATSHSSPEVIRRVVLMYVRFPLSLRNVKDLLLERGIDIVMRRCGDGGTALAHVRRRQRVSRMRGFCHWRWHLNEMYVKLSGEMVYLWRAVDQEGDVMECYVAKAAALTFMKKALKRPGAPDGITTDGLRSYRAAMNDLGNADRQETGRWANTGLRTAIYRFDDESGQCSGSGR